MALRIMHIDLDAFFVSIEQAMNPHLKGLPVVVGGYPGSRGVVACASYEARAYGLKAGMPIATAQRLCPHAIFLPGRFERYQEASHKFMAILRDYTPEIEEAGIDEAYLDLTGLERYRGPLLSIAREMKGRIRHQLHITASVGIASSKSAAKVASDIAKPDGLVEVPPGRDAQFLAPMSLERLPGMGPKATATLAPLGITTIGEFAALPRALVKRLLGIGGQELQSWASGMDARPIMPPAPAKSVSRSTTLPSDTGDRRLIRAVLYYLTERVTTELRQETKGARTVVLKLRYADFQTISRHHTLPLPTSSAETLFHEGVKLLEQALQQRRDKVRLVGIGATQLVEGAVQLSLLDQRVEKGMRLTWALERLRGRHGYNAIQRGVTLPMGSLFPVVSGQYTLHTPSLSR